MSNNKKILKLTIPKGSLQGVVSSLFERAGLNLHFASERDYRPSVSDPELYIKLLRPQEIPNYLIGEDDFDLGISGIDWVKETNVDVEILLDLKIGRVKIVLCVPDDWDEIKSIEDLLKDFYHNNKVLRISTEYLTQTENYLKENEAYQKFYGKSAPNVITPWKSWGDNDKVKIFLSFGATEAKPPDEVDAIIDNTETGSTIRANNLKIIDILNTSTAVLIANNKALDDNWKKEKIKDLVMLLRGVRDASKKLHIFMNVQENNLKILLSELPALKRPTISKLAGDDVEGWYAINTIINKKDFLSLIPKLRVYAQGLVVHEQRQIIDFSEELVDIEDYSSMTFHKEDPAKILKKKIIKILNEYESIKKDVPKERRYVIQFGKLLDREEENLAILGFYKKHSGDTIQDKSFSIHLTRRGNIVHQFLIRKLNKGELLKRDEAFFSEGYPKSQKDLTRNKVLVDFIDHLNKLKL